MKWLVLILLLLLTIPETNKTPEFIIVYPRNRITIMNILQNHIKEYEGLHINNPSYIGYGHKLLNKSERNITNFDSLLIEDLKKNIHVFNSHEDSIALGLLAYNIGNTRVRNEILSYKVKKQRDSVWISYIYYNGKLNFKMRERRMFELNLIQKKGGTTRINKRN